MEQTKCQTPDYPAEQPVPPGDECEKLPETKPPEYKEPDKCKVECECPEGSGGSDSCLEKLIEAQTDPITKGDKAKAFKAELEAFLGKANTAKDEYTQEKYDKLLKQWGEQDHDIAELVRKLVCFIPCWRCVIDCHVCHLLYEMRDAELRVYGDGTWCDEVHDLQDLLYWRTRDRDAKERVFNRIKGLFGSWEKPAQAIEKVLADNAKAIADAYKALGAQDSKVLYDVFLKLIPMHLAIAPPAGVKGTLIDKKFTEICQCDDRKPVRCCGLDIGERSMRQRLIGPQPYLIQPSNYFKLLCCLVEHVYLPAKDSLSAAEAEVAKLDATIKRLKGVIENGLKNFDKTARAAIPASIDCDKYKPKENKKY